MYEWTHKWEQDGFILVATAEVDPYLIPEDPAAFDSVEDYEQRASSFGSEWVYLVINVAAHLDALPYVELGSSLLGGIESDGGENYLEETTQELADEAIADAREHLELIAQRLIR